MALASSHDRLTPNGRPLIPDPRPLFLRINASRQVYIRNRVESRIRP